MPGTLGFTYNELIAEIQDHAEDSSAEFVANMPVIVALGESRLYADLDFEMFDVEVTGTFTINVQLQTKDTEWQATRSLWTEPVGGGAKTFLERRSYEYIVDYQPDETVDTGQPLYYAEFSDTQWAIAPSPDVAYPWTARQIQSGTIAALTAANQNTWLGDNAGDILLYSCMIAAENYLKSEAYDVEKWKAVYGETVPARKMILRDNWRAEYSPIQNAARSVSPTP